MGTISYTNARIMERHGDYGDDLPPTLGVREPRRPSPPTLTPGVELHKPCALEEAPSEDPRVTFTVAGR